MHLYVKNSFHGNIYVLMHVVFVLIEAKDMDKTWVYTKRRPSVYFKQEVNTFSEAIEP